MTTTQLYADIAARIEARLNCINANPRNTEWESKHEQQVLEWVKEFFPSGSGFDCGTKIDLDASSADKLVFNTSFHHMNDCGMYDGWTEHTVTVKPSLAHGFSVTITGRDRNGIKEYMHDCFYTALSTTDHHEQEVAA